IDVRATMRRLDIYSGHADGPALARWIAERAPVAGNLFLVHGEERAMDGLKARVAGSFAPARVIAPALDEVWSIDGSQAQLAASGRPRLSPEKAARIDCHTALSALILDINDAIRAESDERNRARLIRKLRRALEKEDA